MVASLPLELYNAIIIHVPECQRTKTLKSLRGTSKFFYAIFSQNVFWEPLLPNEHQDLQRQPGESIKKYVLINCLTETEKRLNVKQDCLESAIDRIKRYRTELNYLKVYHKNEFYRISSLQQDEKSSLNCYEMWRREIEELNKRVEHLSKILREMSLPLEKKTTEDEIEKCNKRLWSYWKSIDLFLAKAGIFPLEWGGDETHQKALEIGIGTVAATAKLALCFVLSMAVIRMKDG